jgi:predicted RNA-binding protein YlqC (UPF0109 family)
MPNQFSKLATSLKHLGEMEVNHWDFKALLNKDIKELEFSRSLRKLGSVQVMEWDFRTVLPAVNRIAHQEVDVIDLIRRTANYKVMEWDFRNPAPEPKEDPSEQGVKPISPEEMQLLIVKLKNFLEYVAINLIDEPGHARIKVREIEPNVLRFKLILVNRDVSMLIGREGHTASAIRSVLQAASRVHGVQTILQIHSHETEASLNEE